jgi:hypothetical protein
MRRSFWTSSTIWASYRYALCHDVTCRSLLTCMPLDQVEAFTGRAQRDSIRLCEAAVTCCHDSV